VHATDQVFQKQKELESDAQVVVDMVDPTKEGVVNTKTLVEHLHEAP
jgi:hypothetical protein